MFLIALLVCTHTWAAPMWMQISTGYDGSRLQLDFNSFRYSGNVGTATSRFIDSDDDGSIRVRDISVSAIDCFQGHGDLLTYKTKTNKLLYRDSFSTNGTLGADRLGQVMCALISKKVKE